MSVLAQLSAQLEKMLRGLVALLPKLAMAIIVFVLVAAFARLVRRGIERTLAHLGRHQNVGLLLGRIAQWLVVFLGLLVAVTIVFPSFRVSNLVQVLGITSVAIGFAFRDVLQNFLAGILILWTQPFRVGDQIVYQSFEGTVTEIQTRASFIDTYDGRRVVVPNAVLFTSAVTVNTASDRRRIEYDLGIGQTSDIARAKRVILDALGELPEVLADPAPDVLVIDLGDFATKLRIRWWIAPPRRAVALEARDRVLTVVRDRLAAHGIELPFPTTTIVLGGQGGQGASGAATRPGGDGRRADRSGPPS